MTERAQKVVYKSLSLKKSSLLEDSPFIDVLFDDLARRWHSFVGVWHFDRGELGSVEVCCCTSSSQVCLQISYRDGGGREGGGMTLTDYGKPARGGNES